jgi:hypothetical protein
MRARVGLIFALAASGCSCGDGGPALYVDLVTDLRPGIEVAEVRVEVARGPELEAPGIATRRVLIARGDDFQDPRRIADFTGLTPGTYVVRVELFDADARRTGHRRSLLMLDDQYVLRVVITRDCREVDCPAPGDPTDATECAGGTCARPDCMPGDPMCTECDGAEDCTGGGACEIPMCAEGVCVFLPCAMDAGPLPDGGPPRDGGPDAGTAPDGGPPTCATACDDGNACTDDACVGGSCAFTPNAAACDDGVFCNGNDTCAATACSVHAGTPCRGAATCDEGMRRCIGCDVDADCGGPSYGPWSSCGGFDTTCDETGTRSREVAIFNCSDSACVRGSTTTEMEGCSEPRSGVGCDDGDGCTLGDSCGGGTCNGGGAPDCNDGNACTSDYCSGGCRNDPNADPCDDGSVCTVGDACSGGSCAPGAPMGCDDGNPCTDDSCDSTTGCTFTNNSAPCSDGIDCTVGDVCSGGTCLQGLADDSLCPDDGRFCTQEFCSRFSGCNERVQPCFGECSGCHPCRCNTMADSCECILP